MQRLEIYRRILPSIGPIIFRNVFLLVNIIIFFVVILLFIFGNVQAGLFLGIVFFLNTLIVIAQDIHARVLLEKLQMLTALQVIRINGDKTETIIRAEEIKKGDLLKLKLGDQTPCEGILVSTSNLEISEALVTGESTSFLKKDKDKIIAGAIITSGFGVMEAQGLFKDSRLSKIKGEAERYTASLSSIEEANNMIIKYSGFILLAVILFVVGRGILIHAPRIQIVTNVGALASMLVPQGLIVTITILFAIGAASYSKRHVLFQEINATEKLGRIKNLCIDKTGTLTDNILVVQDMHLLEGLEEQDSLSLIYTVIIGLGDSSETILAIKKYLEKKINDNNKNQDIKKEISNVLPFSSWRRYGAVELTEKNILQSVFVGTPDIMFERISDPKEKKWLQDVTGENAHLGRRVLCIARVNGSTHLDNLSELHLSIVAIFVYNNTLRQGIKEAIKFFQDRGVRIRVLSGDNADTVEAVTKSVEINNAENIITGDQMKKWTDLDFTKHSNEYSVFAQVLPEQKVKLVEAFKQDGFTAMVGDGVNDALAMKRSDLGIAMFGGVPVTRQLADVILMTNSFSDLPGAVELADHFIRSIEISSGIYINMSLVGLLFFIVISIFGYSYPLTPLNITFINYFTVGFPTVLISYWALRPSNKIPRTADKPFMKRVMPLVFYAGIAETIIIAVVFALSPQSAKVASSNILVLLSFIISGFIFLFLAAKVYCGILTKKEKLQLILLGIFELIVLYFSLQIPFILRFFNIIPI